MSKLTTHRYGHDLNILESYEGMLEIGHSQARCGLINSFAALCMGRNFLDIKGLANNSTLYLFSQKCIPDGTPSIHQTYAL